MLRTPAGTPVKAIPINALFDATGLGPNPETDTRQALRDAHIIMGLDVMSCRKFLVFGRGTQKKIASGRLQVPRTEFISLDRDTDELDNLIALVQVVKGRHGYRPGA